MSELKEVTSEIIGLQGNKIFRTVKYLTIKPGQVVSEYCKGEKSKYLSPVVYYLGLLGIVYYISSVTGCADEVARQGAKGLNEVFLTMGFDSTTDKLNNAFSTILLNQTFATVVNLPVILFFQWLVFRLHNRSFKDNSWFALYIGGHSILMNLPVYIVWYIEKDYQLFTYFGQLFLITIFVYGVWAAMQFYQIKLGRSFFLNSLVFILSAISYFIIFYSIIILVLTYS